MKLPSWRLCRASLVCFCFCFAQASLEAELTSRVKRRYLRIDRWGGEGEERVERQIGKAKESMMEHPQACKGGGGQGVYQKELVYLIGLLENPKPQGDKGVNKKKSSRENKETAFL